MSTTSSRFVFDVVFEQLFETCFEHVFKLCFLIVFDIFEILATGRLVGPIKPLNEMSDRHLLLVTPCWPLGGNRAPFRKIKDLDLKGWGTGGAPPPGPCTPPFKIQMFVYDFPYVFFRKSARLPSSG